MDKRYQIFISSTFADLQEERSKVIQAIMELDCIPAGMEIFPAIDEEQFEFIKRVIDDCDYYLLIIGGRYGTVSELGVSYTEMEYDYAISKGMKVLAFVHGKPESIPLAKSEIIPDSIKKLTDFRSKVGTGRLVRFWKEATELPGLVALSLPKTIRTYPAVGWIRGNTTSDPEVYKELSELRKENEELKKEIEQVSKHKIDVDLASFDDEFVVRGNCIIMNVVGDELYESWQLKITWNDLFNIISPVLTSYTADHLVKDSFALRLSYKAMIDNEIASGSKIKNPNINEDDYTIIKLQIKALGLIDIHSNPVSDYIQLTELGERKMLRLRTK